MFETLGELSKLVREIKVQAAVYIFLLCSMSLSTLNNIIYSGVKCLNYGGDFNRSKTYRQELRGLAKAL